MRADRRTTDRAAQAIAGMAVSAAWSLDGHSPLRRTLLAHGGLIALLLGSGVSGAALAGMPADPLFGATTMDDVLHALGGAPSASTAIDLALPELTENGAMVPVSVTSRLPRTTQIIVLADANPFPLAATFDIAPGTEPYISTRLKLAQSCTVAALVRADGRLYAVTRDTSVTVGGCGG